MKKVLKCRSRYGEDRWETDLGNDWYQLEGPSHYMRYGGLDDSNKNCVTSPDSLGFVDFDGGPFYSINDLYQPGAESTKLTNTKAWERPGVIVELRAIDSDRPNYGVCRIKIKKETTMSSFKLNGWDSKELAEFKTIMQVAFKDLLEDLAEQEHEQWMEWAKTLIEKEPQLSSDRVDRWKTYMVPYSQLSDEVKEFDRIWARKAMNLFLDSMAASRLEDLIRKNKEQQRLIDSLQDEIQKMLKHHQDLKNNFTQLREDVKKLFGGAFDKTTLANYISLTEPKNGS